MVCDVTAVKISRIVKPVHTSNNVEATFDVVAVLGYNVERVFREISSFQQNRNKLNVFNLFRLCRKDEISFDIVAKTTFDFV